MKKTSVSREIIIGAILLGLLFVSSCSNYGKEKRFNGTQIFYTSAVSENDVDKLITYLVNSEFIDGGEKTVQLNKSGNTYEFRMVVKKGIEQDQEYKDLGKIMGAEISQNVFEGQNVDVHFCDDKLKTLVVLPMSSSKFFTNMVLVGTTWSINIDDENESLGIFIFEANNVIKSNIFGGYINGYYSDNGFKIGSWSLDQNNGKLIITIMETDVEEWQFEYTSITDVKMSGNVFENKDFLGKTEIYKLN
jgi:hypothetical protein